MATRVDLVDLPSVLPRALRSQTDRAEQLQELRNLAQSTWIAKGEIGYTILKYEDVVAMLRDKRWHSAVSSGMSGHGALTAMCRAASCAAAI